jgi:hypothetical protein
MLEQSTSPRIANTLLAGASAMAVLGIGAVAYKFENAHSDPIRIGSEVSRVSPRGNNPAAFLASEETQVDCGEVIFPIGSNTENRRQAVGQIGGRTLVLCHLDEKFDRNSPVIRVSTQYPESPKQR